MPTPITAVSGIGATTAADLAAQGINSAEDLANAPLDRIVAVKGFGPARAEQIKQAAADALKPAADEPAKAEKASGDDDGKSKKGDKKEKEKQTDKSEKDKGKKKKGKGKGKGKKKK